MVCYVNGMTDCSPVNRIFVTSAALTDHFGFKAGFVNSFYSMSNVAVVAVGKWFFMFTIKIVVNTLSVSFPDTTMTFSTSLGDVLLENSRIRIISREDMVSRMTISTHGGYCQS